MMQSESESGTGWCVEWQPDRTDDPLYRTVHELFEERSATRHRETVALGIR